MGKIEIPAASNAVIPTSTTLENYPTGPGSIREQEAVSRRGKQRLYRTIGETAVALAILAPATAVGVAVGLGVATRPSEISIAPGISAEVQPTLSEDLTIAYGATVVIPGVHKDVAGLTASAKINITKLDSQSHTSTEQATSAIITGSLESANSAVFHAFEQRARQGAAVGAGVFGLLGLGGLLIRKRLGRTKNEDDSELELAHEHAVLDVGPPDLNGNGHSEIYDEARAKPATNMLRRKMAAFAVAGVVVLGGAYLANEEYASLNTPLSESTLRLFPNNPNNPVVDLVSEYAPILKDASISGDVGYYARESLTKVFERMEVVDSRWQERADHFATVTLPEFRSGGGMDWQKDPDIIAFAQVSDIHDNRPFLKHFLPEVLGAIGVDFVVNTGDQMNYSGKALLDDGALERFAQALPTSSLAIMVAGNHDETSMYVARQLSFGTHGGQRYHPLIPLDKDNDFSATLGGLVFVGSPDLNETTQSGTVPASHEGQIANDVKQGRLIADRACEITDETGVKPIVLAHEKEATYETIVRGCAALILAGHNHKTYPVRAYHNFDRSTTYQQTLGTASGDGPNNLTAIYNGPTTEGAISIWLYNVATQQPEKTIYLSYSAHQPVSIQANDLLEPYEAKNATDDSKIMNVLNPQS